MRTIWKFPLPVDDRVLVKMPKAAQVLTVQPQCGSPCIWAEVEDGNVEEIREFAVFGTGNPMPVDTKDERLGYLASVQCGPFVWHVYEVFQL